MEDDSLRIEFGPRSEAETHACTSFRDGDWIIYRCPECADYERRFNWRTGEMKVRRSKSGVLHAGTYTPQEYKDAFVNLN